MQTAYSVRNLGTQARLPARTPCPLPPLGEPDLPSWSHGRSRVWSESLWADARPIGQDPAATVRGVRVARRYSRGRTAATPCCRTDGKGPTRPNRGRHALARGGEGGAWMLVPHREHRDRAAAADTAGYELRHTVVRRP